MFLRPLAAFSVAVLMTSTASALDWAGVHIGLNAGAGFNPGDTGELEFRRVDGTDNSAAINNAFGNNFNGNFDAGSIVAAQVGAEFAQGRLIYGVVLDIAKTDISQDQSAFSSTPATYVERRSVDTLATLKGKLGWRHNNITPYITAGLAYGDVDYSWQGNSGAFRGDNGDDGGWTAGYVIGIGVDIAYNEQMRFGVEYSLVNLGDEDFQTRFDGGPNDPTMMGGATMAFGSPASGGTVAEGSDDDFDFQTIRFTWAYQLKK